MLEVQHYIIIPELSGVLTIGNGIRSHLVFFQVKKSGLLWLFTGNPDPAGGVKDV